MSEICIAFRYLSDSKTDFGEEILGKKHSHKRIITNKFETTIKYEIYRKRIQNE